MFPNTLTAAGTIFTKISEDRQSGTVFLQNGSTRSHPSVLTIKHDVPGLGKKGVARHLLSYSTPMLDADDLPQAERVTVNFTVNVPQVSYGDAQVTRSLEFILALLCSQSAAGTPIGASAEDLVSDTSSVPVLLANGHF